jgi:CheY-like chemotaxis protein
MPSRALVVDDESAICELIQGILTTTGMEVLSLTKSAEAAAYIRAEKFAIAVLDMLMPAPNGVEVARQICQSGVNRMTPVVMLSEDQKPGVVAEAFGAGANFFLYKPIDRPRLLKLVRATQGAVEQERRRFRRLHLQFKVRLGFDNKEFDGETLDISLNGMLVKARTSLPVGSPVRVSLYAFPHGKPIVGSGSVVRTVAENQMGIYFNQWTAAESERLQDLLLPRILRAGPQANVTRSP